jgi:D-proline reductase (dithiol) PrdB
MANVRDRMEFVRPPRVLFVRFPRGSMLGEPFNTERQRRIIMDALAALRSMTEPGAVCDLPYRWKNPD